MSKQVKNQSGLIQLPDEDESEVCWDEYSNWKHWCRLCAKEDRSNIDVFRKKEGSETDNSCGTLATAIGKYFWVNIKTDDELPKHVCGECETLINELCTFTERVNKVQTMFALLLNIKNDKLIDPNELRLQYGLLDEERQHIIRSPEPQASEYEMEHEVEMLVHEVEELLEDDQDLGDKEDEKEELEIHYEQEENEEGEQEQEHEEEEEEAEELEEKEVDLKPDLFDENMENDEQEEELEDENEEEQEPELDAEIMEQLEQELEINTLDYEVTEEENADATNSYSQEHLEIEDEDETLLSQVQQEIKELRKFCKKIPTNLKFRKKIADSVDELAVQQEKKQVEKHNVEKHNVEKQTQSGVAQMSSKIITNIGDDKKQEMEIILPPKRRRGRPARTSDDYEKNKKIKVKAEPTDGNVSEEHPQLEFKFECGLCPKKYKSCVIYKRHMLDVHNIIDDTVVEYTCEECSKTFSSERILTLHIRSHLPMELKQVHPCPYCDKRFTKEAIMVQHISGAHLNEKPFICEECGRGLKTNAALREHKLTHTDDCPFECEVCHKRFKNKARLKIHSDIHAETIYKCAICGVILNTRRTLNMHMLVHSDVKAFKCDYCGNAFKRAKALKNHLLIHTGLKPYICNFCYKPFSNGSNCRSHKKKAHPEELAALEASGEKVQQTNVPKLDHLRAVSKAAENLQPVSKQTTLPPNWREILLKAEERATRLDEKYKHEPAETDDSKSQSQLEDPTDVEVEAELEAMEC